MGVIRTILIILGVVFLTRIVRRFFVNGSSDRTGAKKTYRRSDSKKKINFNFKDVEDADFEEIKKDQKTDDEK